MRNVRLEEVVLPSDGERLEEQGQLPRRGLWVGPARKEESQFISGVVAILQKINSVNVIKLFTAVIFECSQKAGMFVPRRIFETSDVCGQGQCF